MEPIEVLKRSEVFLGLDTRSLRKIIDLPSCKREAYYDHEVIFRAGETSKRFYLIEEGNVNLLTEVRNSLANPPQPAIVRTITTGGTFGWSALVPPHVRILTAISRGSSKIMAIAGSELRTLFDREPSLGYEALKSLMLVTVSRVRNIEQLLIAGKGSPFFERPKTE